MTSKNLFYKLLIEDLKRRIWTIVLASIVFFLYFPVFGTLMIGNYNRNIYDSKDYKERLFERVLSFMGPEDYMVITITIIGAIICGLSGFFYLHSRKKVDFYHSIPVRREFLFTITYINGLLIYFIPYVINVIVYSIVLKFNDLMNIELLTATLSAIGINLLYYTLIYTIVIIAVMLTGNFVISCFGTAVFLLYGPMLMMLKEIYLMSFFKTYYATNTSFLSVFNFLSPIGSYVDTAIWLNYSNHQGIFTRILTVILVTVALIGVAVFLYRKRPSEAAGKAMAFRISKPIIKFLLTIPLALGGGIIFREITDRSSNGWFIFGLIFALVIVYAIIEVIYNLDIRSAFNHKRQLLACGGIITVIACIFQFDLFQYDSYMPKKDNIQSMSVSISGLDDSIMYHELELKSERYEYMSGEGFQLKYMELKNIDTAYDMAVTGLKNININEEDNNYIYYNVKYKLKSGREIYRIYKLKALESYDMLSDLYANPEFKEGHYPIYKSDISKISRISCYNKLRNIEFSLDGNEKKELIDTYKEELSHLTLDEISKDYPVAVLSLQYYNVDVNYNIYPSFEKTITFLKDHGFDATRNIETKDIKQIIVNNYRLVTDEEYSVDYIVDNNGTQKVSESVDIYTDEKSRTATYNDMKDKENIEEIFPNLVDNDYYWNNRSVISVEESVDVSVVIRKDEFGNEERYSYFFRKGNIPDFVKSDIKIQETK